MVHNPQISATVPDWSREAKPPFAWHPARSLLASIRGYQRAKSRGGAISALSARIAVLRHRFWSAVTGADIPLTAKIGGGLLLPHPNGIVIHPDAVIGPNCLLFQQVTIGAAHGGVPVIGGAVDIGAGAKVLGSVVVDDHVQIGANAVVTKNAPFGAVMVGIPARNRAAQG